MIYKYNLTTDRQPVMPKGAVLLDVQMQRDQFCLWALIDPDEHRQEVRSIRIYGTGDEISKRRPHKYIATVQDGSFVWHIFEELL